MRERAPGLVFIGSGREKSWPGWAATVGMVEWRRGHVARSALFGKEEVGGGGDAGSAWLRGWQGGVWGGNGGMVAVGGGLEVGGRADRWGLGSCRRKRRLGEQTWRGELGVEKKACGAGERRKAWAKNGPRKEGDLICFLFILID